MKGKLLFDFLPPIVEDVLTLIAFVAGPSGLIYAFLNSRNANRKLIVDEAGLSVTEFDSLNAAYKALYETEKTTAKESIEELHKYKAERENILAELAEMRDFQRRRDTLFLSVVRRNQIVLTAEESAEFEATKPKSFRNKPSTA